MRERFDEPEQMEAAGCFEPKDTPAIVLAEIMRKLREDFEDPMDPFTQDVEWERLAVRADAVLSQPTQEPASDYRVTRGGFYWLEPGRWTRA